tara:strand:+ start:3464 stop:3841 length:378 start_codon:yes stop_codon:yes gene_type:complete
MILKQYIKAVTLILGVSLLLFAAPLYLVDPSLSVGYICGIPPQVFVSLSWVWGAWYAFKNCPEKVFQFTLSFIPIRMGVEVAWFLMVAQNSDISLAVAVGSGIMHFALFMIPQAVTINNLTTTNA